MAKNDNPHALRMYQAITEMKSADMADSLAENHPLSKSANVEQKQKWACEVCAYLESQCTPEESVSIRRMCRCNDGKTMVNEILGAIRKSEDLASSCTHFTQHNKYAFLEYVSDQELHFGYHACVCSCIKHSTQDVLLLWCECSVGYALSMFRTVFGDTVEVTLLENVKSGGQCCKMKINWS